MKRHFILILTTALCLCGCSKNASTGPNDANKRYFDAWMQIHFPDIFKQGPTFPGYYVLEHTPGNGELIGTADDSLFIVVDYTLRTLDGTISASTLTEVNQQIGSYNEVNSYIPQIWYVDGMASGLKSLIQTLNVGSICKAVIPCWLVTYSTYDTEEEYLNNEGGESGIYDIRIKEKIHKNIYEWEIDSICRYIARHYPDKFSPDPALVRPDSVSTHGMYYIQLREPSDTSTLAGDSTVYINYTGRLLNGKVFDTTIRDTAMKYGLFDATKEYTAMRANLSTEYANVTLGDDDSEVISGFARTISLMKANEKGIGIFCSLNGYDYTGSGETILPYSPLMFEIEMVPEPE